MTLHPARRTRACVLATLLCVLAPLPAHAAGIDGFLTGVIGILTFPADPVLDTMDPPSDFDEIPGSSYTRYPAGFLYGLFYGVGRALFGVTDIALTPLWVVPTLSPEPRIDVIPFYTIQYEP